MKKYIEEIHKNAKEKGFWGAEEKLRGLLLDDEGSHIYTNLKDEDKFFDNYVIPQKIMLVVSELGEAIESLRKDRRADVNAYERANSWKTNEDAKHFEQYVKDTVEDEIADAIIRLFDLCGYYNIDIEKFINLKMKYNATRSRLHGKEF